MPRFSRRSFLHLSAAASAAAAFRVVTEPMLAAAARRRPHAKDAVLIDSNENPLGPCQAARDAIAAIIPQGGRYSDNLTDELVATFAQSEGLNPESIYCTAGSTPPLSLSVLAFTSPQKSYVTADPGFETGMNMSSIAGARVVKVPLTKSYGHDVKAMLAAAPDAGVFYICNPNNPTGTLTPHSDIEYLVANKPKDAIVLIDEAYIHLSEAQSTLDLVKAGKDVIVLRTFSKVYGMAGLRCGFVVARPDLLEKAPGSRTRARSSCRRLRSRSAVGSRASSTMCSPIRSPAPRSSCRARGSSRSASTRARRCAPRSTAPASWCSDGLANARQAVGALRGEELPGVEQLESLVATFSTDTNADVTLTIEGNARALPADASLALYRGAQEALTNIVRYAPGAVTTVVLRYERSHDADRRGPPRRAEAGHRRPRRRRRRPRARGHARAARAGRRQHAGRPDRHRLARRAGGAAT